MEAKGWQDERLKVMVLQAVALQAHGEQDQAVHLLCDALALAEPGGFIRLFVDEGRPMAHLLSEAEALGRMPDYIGKLLAVFEAEEQKSEATRICPTCPTPHRATQPTRGRSPPAHCARPLKSGDKRAACPRPGNGERTQ